MIPSALFKDANSKLFRSFSEAFFIEESSRTLQALDSKPTLLEIRLSYQHRVARGEESLNRIKGVDVN